MKEVLKKFISNKKIHRIGQIIVFAIPIVAGSVVILQFFLFQFLLPVEKDLDVLIIEGWPDAISEDLHLIPIKCKRVGSSAGILIDDFKVYILALEGIIEKVTYTGIIPKNQKEVDEILKSREVSSMPPIEYPPIDEGSEFTINVFICTDGGIPRLRLVGYADGKKAKMIRWQEILDDILSRVR